MTASTLKTNSTLPLALTSILLTAAFLLPALGQPPTSNSKNESAPSAASRLNESDQDRLQGKWQIHSIAIDGKVFKRDDNLNDWKATFGNDLIIEGDRLAHATANKARFTLDATLQPKQITFHSDDGKLTFPGIYTLQDNALTICLNGNGADPRRPNEFATKASVPILLIELKKLPTTK